MEDWEERLIKEQAELKEKFVKLTEFINSEEFYELSANNKQVLKNQKIAMELYLNVLNMRLYENVDKIVVPDLGMMQLFGNVMGGSMFNFSKTDEMKRLEEKLREEGLKTTGVDKTPVVS